MFWSDKIEQETKGNVFNVEHYHVHDGEGIRGCNTKGTKGCNPLKIRASESLHHQDVYKRQVIAFAHR